LFKGFANNLNKNSFPFGSFLSAVNTPVLESMRSGVKVISAASAKTDEALSCEVEEAFPEG